MSETIRSIFAQLPKDRVCIVSGEQQLTAAECLKKAEVLRARTSIDSNTSIALLALKPIELILALIAFDGLAKELLLLPQTLEASITEHLLKEKQCQIIVSTGLLIQQAEPALAPNDIADQDTKWLLATSGTTNTPKLIQHSFYTLSRRIQRNHQKGQQLIWGLAYDPCRFAGMQVILQSLIGSSTLALAEEATFDHQIRAFLNAGVNALSATPSMWRKMLMDGRIHSLGLQQITLGGEIADQPVLNALQSRYPKARIVHIYASTEAGVGFAVKDRKAGFPAAWLNNKASGVELRLDNQNHLLIKPEILPKGLAIQDRLTTDGYLDTEDLVTIKNDRVLFLGRASGAINVGGNKVNPEQIEAFIREIPRVVDVKVYGKPSSVLGQLVATDIQAEAGVDYKKLREDLVKHCQQGLASWQRPMLINFVDCIHITATGKKER